MLVKIKILLSALFIIAALNTSLARADETLAGPQTLHQCDLFRNSSGQALVGSHAPAISYLNSVPGAFQYFVTTISVAPGAQPVHTPVQLVSRTQGGFDTVVETYRGGAFELELLYVENGKKLITGLIRVGKAEANCSWPL